MTDSTLNLEAVEPAPVKKAAKPRARAAETVVPGDPDFSVQVLESEGGALPAARPVAPARKRNPASPRGQAVSGRAIDRVEVSRLTGDTARRKSLSVHHLQRRLAELGFAEAAAGLDGRYDALTARAVSAWQTANGYPLGALDLGQTRAIFDNDSNVEVHP